jgi:hypothetical protein
MERSNVDRPNWTAAAAMFGDVKRAWSGLGDVQKRVRGVSGVAWSDDRLIKAVVGPRGQLIELDIDPRVYRTPNSKELAATIVATVRLAVEDASRQTKAIVDESLPSDLRIDRIGDGDLGKLIQSHDADLREEGDDNG